MAFRREEIKALADICWVTDLAAKREIALKRWCVAGQEPVFVGVEKFVGDKLPKQTADELDRAYAAQPVDAVIVSTTPEQHRAYADWAITKGLPVIIDKPITARAHSMTSPGQARKILEDWEHLNKLASEHRSLVLVNSHRRFHPGYMKVSQLLQEVAEETGTGVTSLSSFNSDGQWRLPQELLDIHYHGFENGNGVISHFGYHYLDLAALWYYTGTPARRRADTLRVNSTMSSALNYSKQMTTRDANRVLEKVGEPTPRDNDVAVHQQIREFGEMDAFCSVEMMRDDVATAHMSIQLLHSGFSQRAWTKPATNLYKENGRVRWENHLIQQGPFQSIEIRSFQAVQPNWKKPGEGIPRWELGGSDHLEINVYRNSILGKPALETINCKDLVDNIPAHDVMHEDTKANVLLLFISEVAIRQKRAVAEHIPKKIKQRLARLSKDDYDHSLLKTHQATTALMSAFYESHANRLEAPGKTNWVEKEILW